MSEIKNINCQICYNLEHDYNRPPCECNICLDCLYEWIKIKNEESIHLKNEYFSCPNSVCNKSVDKIFFFSKLNEEKLNNINGLLLKKYLNSSEDIIKCPKSGCDYAGYKELTNGICQEPYKCEICLSEWGGKNVEINNENYYMWVEREIKKGMYNFLEELSELRIRLITKPCINCNRNVQKFTGCNHITCICKQEFCFNCLGVWNQHENAKCSDKINFRDTLTLFCILTGILKILFSFEFIYSIISFIFWIFYIHILGLIFAAFSVWVLFIYFSIIKATENKNSHISYNNLTIFYFRHLNKFKILFTFIVIGYIFWFIYLLKYYDSILYSFKLLAMEAVFSIILCGSIFIIYKIKNNFRRITSIRSIYQIVQSQN